MSMSLFIPFDYPVRRLHLSGGDAETERGEHSALPSTCGGNNQHSMAMLTSHGQQLSATTSPVRKVGPCSRQLSGSSSSALCQQQLGASPAMISHHEATVH